VLENDFDALLFVNGHGGNGATIGDATSIVGDAHPDAQVLGLTYFELAERFIHEVRESETGGMAHAGEFETSLMLHLEPELVDADAMEGTYMEESYDIRTKDSSRAARCRCTGRSRSTPRAVRSAIPTSRAQRRANASSNCWATNSRRSSNRSTTRTDERAGDSVEKLSRTDVRAGM